MAVALIKILSFHLARVRAHEGGNADIEWPVYRRSEIVRRTLYTLFLLRQASFLARQGPPLFFVSGFARSLDAVRRS